MGSIDAIIRLVARVAHLLLDYLKIKRRESSYEERQKERAEIEEDPAAWFSDHFSGSGVRPDAGESESDASKADKADD